MRKHLFLNIFFLFVLVFVLFAGISSAQNKDFIYSDNGRRDPFWPLVSASGMILIYDNNVEFSDMILEGIIYDPKGEKLAIINTKIVKPSDNIGGFLVMSIEQDYVVLRKADQEFILRSKKEK